MFRKKASLAAITAVIAFAGSSLAQSAPLFSDNFDLIPPAGPGYTPSPPGLPPVGWATSGSGSIDGLPAGGSFSYLCYSGSGCVDLDGTDTGGGTAGGALMHTVSSFSLLANQTYELSFLLGGNRRNSLSDTVQFGFLDTGLNLLASGTLVVLAAEALTLRSFQYTPGAATTAYVFFQNLSSADNQGGVLDNVSLAPVPLPAAVWLLLSGLGVVGVMARRRRITST